MVDIVTRLGKGSPLTNAEVDANFTNLAEVSGVTGEPMGHEDRTTSTISFNASTRTFTIAPVASSFTVWCKGKKVVVSSAQTVTIPNTTGMYSIYYDANGVLSAKAGYFTFSLEAPTAYVYWNAATGTAPYFGDERHGVVLDWQTHEYLHRTRGAALASGFSASDYVLGGNGSSNSHAQLTLEGGTFFDEDMKIIVTATNTPTAGTWEQDLLSPARIPVLYLSGTGWVIDAPTDYPLKQGASRPQYNAYSGGVWSTADVANNKYATSWILATNNLTYPVIAIIGQSQNDLQSAAEAVDFTALQLPGFPSVEFRPLYKLIFQCADSCTNAVHASLVSITDIRSIAAAGTAASIVTDHGNLSGLSDDDHPQYIHVDTLRTVSAAVKASFLPSQTSNAGKFLQTDGTAALWQALTSGNVTTALGFTPYNATNPSGYISGITSGMVTTALGFTPYNATNPSGYVTAAGARGAISVTGAGSYDSATGVINIVGGVTSFNTRTGAITLSSADVTTALGFTPYNNTNPSGYITGITSTMVTTALGFTPYNSSNPSGYITSSALSSYLPLGGGTVSYIGISNASAINLRGAGSGTYNTSWIYSDTTVNSWEAPKTTDSGGGARVPFILTWRGGYGSEGGLRLTGGSSGELGGNVILHAGNFSSYAAPVVHSHNYVPINPDGDGTSWTYSDENPTINDVGVGGGQRFGADGSSYEGFLQAKILNAYNGFVNSANGYYVGNYDFGANSNTYSTTRVIDGNGNFYGGKFIALYGNPNDNIDGAPWYGLGGAGNLFGSGGGVVHLGGYYGLRLRTGSTTLDLYQGSAYYSSTFNAATLQNNGNQVLHAGNYTSYAPSLTGSGASGTWGISISGNSGTTSGFRALYAGDVGSVNSASVGITYNYSSVGVWSGTPSGMGYGSVYTLGGNAGNSSVLSLQLAADINHNSTSSTKQLWFRTGNNLGFQNDWKEIVHAGNYSSYALPLAGGTLSGALLVNTIRATDGVWVLGKYGTEVSLGSAGATNEIRFNSASNAAFEYRGNAILHAGNYSSYALPLSGGTLTGSLLTTTAANSWGVYSNTNGSNYSGIWFSTNVGELLLRKADGSLSTRIAADGSSAFINNNNILHAGNYTSYSPSLTGSGASGTWSINVTGSAGSVAWTNVSSRPTAVSSFTNDSGYITSSANITGQAGFVGASDTRTISPSSHGNGRLTFGFTSWANNNTATWADYLHLRSYTDSTGGADNLVMFNKGAIGMRIWQQAFGSATAYSNYVDVLTSGNYTSYALPLSGGTLSGAIRASQITAGGSTNTDANLGVQGTSHLTGTIYYGGTVGNVNSWSSISTSSSGTHTFSGSRFIFDRYGYGSQSLIDAQLGSIALGQYTTIQSGVRVEGGVRQGNNLARPLASWGSSGATGMVIFKLPGSSGNYGMLHMVFDIYEYNSNSVSTVIVGGHNWASNWYNTGANVVGQLGKQVRLGYKDGQYCVVFGDSSSYWEYGQIVLRKIQNGAYYDNIMDLGAAIDVSFTSTESFSNIGGDLRALRTPASFNAGGAITQSGNQVLHAGNYTSYSPSLGGSGASGTWGISITGNAGSLQGYQWGSAGKDIRGSDIYADNWLRNYNSGTGLYNQATGNHWYSDGQYWNVGYGGTTGIRLRNGHAGTVLGYLYAETSGNFGLLHSNAGWAVQVYPGGSGYLHGTWNGGNIRANRANGNFYIDDNYGCGIVGAYASTRYQGVFFMGDSYKMSADGTSLANMYGIGWSHPNAGGAAGNLTDHGMLIINNGGFRCAISNSIVASGNVTAYSDERLKTNWRDMPENFVARLAQVKVGIYDRTDEVELMTQVGVSAQSFQKLLPEAILTAKDEMQTLSVSYGNAALASAVELAKDNVELRARIERLESLINKLIGD